jgi:hypothetical protein
VTFYRVLVALFVLAVLWSLISGFLAEAIWNGIDRWRKRKAWRQGNTVPFTECKRNSRRVLQRVK